MAFVLENCKYDFASDNINIFVNLYDCSGSMEQHTEAMERANEAFYNDFSKFEERGSISIAKAEFADAFRMSSFKSVKDFDVSYETYGNTALYDAIIKTANNIIEYYNELVKRLNVRARITFLVFSDGEDNCSYYGSYEKAESAIKELNSLDATTVFVAFDEAIKSGIGENLNFTCIRNITSVRELVSCMGGELSKSCKEQSKSAYSLKSEFFSKADKNSDEDEASQQPIYDDDFFNV